MSNKVYREFFERAKCERVGCTCQGTHDVLVLRANCCNTDKVCMSWNPESGCMDVVCGVCGAEVCEIPVASSAENYLPPRPPRDIL